MRKKRHDDYYNFRLRMDHALHDALAEEAEKSMRSMNKEILWLLRHSISKCVAYEDWDMSRERL